MHTLAPAPLTVFLDRMFDRLCSELRIDVEQRPASIEAELALLHRRLGQPGDPLHASVTRSGAPPGFIFRYREAGPDHYLYVVDRAQGRLAGYTAFNRLSELDRRLAAWIRAPHSKYAPDYQRRGLASAVYEWALARGWCLVSGARQSSGAHALWRSLARRHHLGFVSLRGRHLDYLGEQVSAAVRDEIPTRMILLGAGWDLERLRTQTGDLKRPR